MNFITKAKHGFLLSPINKKDEPISVYINIELKSNDKHNGNEVASFIGDMYIGKKNDRNYHGGQINDTLNDIVASNQYNIPDDLKYILDLWNKHHLNDLYMGTKKQMDYLTSIDFKPIDGSKYYEEAKEILIKNGLYNDNGNIFGKKWYFQAIPHEDLMQIYNIIDYQKTTDLMENYDMFEISILREEITKTLKTNGFDFNKIDKITIIHNDSATDFTEYLIGDNNFKDFFSSRELKIFEDLKENGRHIDRYIETGEIDLTTPFGILLAEIAITNSPSAMRFLDLKFDENIIFPKLNLYTQDEHKDIIDELIEPYLIEHGIDGLIFTNYLNDSLMKKAIDNTSIEKLKNLPNYLLDLNSTSLNHNNKVLTFHKDSAIQYSQSIIFEELSKTLSENLTKTKEISNDCELRKF